MPARIRKLRTTGWLSWRSCRKKSVQLILVGCDQIFVLPIVVVTHVHAKMRGYLEKFFEALDAAAEKISPLRTLQDRFACVIEVNHAAEVGVIPAAKWNSRNEVFLVHKAKGLKSEQLVVVPAKVVEADARLAKSVDAVYQPNRIHHGQGRSANDSKGSPKTVAR